jgi:hypothetical protein
MMKIISSILLGLLTASCAADRPIEKLSDVDQSRFEKAPFLIDTPWLQKVTIVKTGEQPAFGFVGLQSQVQLGRFEFSKEKLKFLNARSPYESSQAEAGLINSWDVFHSERRLAESGGKVTNVEEENYDISWWEKRFFTIDWNTANISESASFPFTISKNCWQKSASAIVEGSQEVSVEHISFTVAVDYEIDENCLTYERYNEGHYTHTLHYKYSFIPLPASDYEPYLYSGENDPLIAKFGFFNSIVTGLAEDGRKENKFIMNRWHPKKTHIFYFAEDFPDQYKWVYNDETKGVFRKINEIFEKNELETRFEVRENDGTKKFGDLRYSFLKVIEELNPRAPLGYGPSDANPLTGELLAANSMIWTGFLRYHVQTLQKETKRSANVYEDSSLMLQLKNTLGGDPKTWTATSAGLEVGADAGQSFRFLLPQYTYGAPGNGYAHIDPDAIWQPKGIEDLLTEYALNPDEQLTILAKEADQQIQDEMQAIRDQKFDALSTTIYGWEQALSDIQLSLQDGEEEQVIFDRILYATSIHEFGHNVSLRHNFYGSVDKSHFGKEDEGQAHLSSSIMDYMQLRDDNHGGFGRYDEAALLYAYSSGKKDLAKEGKTTFLYCTDEHVYVNALCNRWDRGSTPSEIALALVERYENLYWIRNFRNDRAYWSTSSYSSQIYSTMSELKKFLKFYDDTYNESDFIEKMSRLDFTEDQLIDHVGVIQKDMKQAALIAAGFYDAVMQQGFSDRPFNETYDTWSGSLQRQGIATDKLFAAYFLLGDSGIGYNPNNGVNPTSFLPLRQDPDIGEALTGIIQRNVMDAGDMYLGFDSFSRVLYAQSAADYQDASGSGGELEQLRIACFAPDTFELRFNIDDVYSFSKDAEPAHVLSFETLTLDSLDENADYYFRSGTTEAAVININGNFYVSSKERNPLSYELIQGQVRHEILELYMVYRLITEGRIPECL